MPTGHRVAVGGTPCAARPLRAAPSRCPPSPFSGREHDPAPAPHHARVIPSARCHGAAAHGERRKPLTQHGLSSLPQPGAPGSSACSTGGDVRRQPRGLRPCRWDARLGESAHLGEGGEQQVGGVARPTGLSHAERTEMRAVTGVGGHGRCPRAGRQLTASTPPAETAREPVAVVPTARRTRRRRTGRRPGSPWQRFRRRPRARRSNRVVGGRPQWLPALARSQPYGELGRLDVTGEGRAVAQVGLRNPCDAVDHALASPRRHHACSPASPTTPAPRQDPAQARAARRGAAGPPTGGGPAQSSRVPAYMSSISSLNSRSTTGRLSFRLGVRSPCSTSRSRGSTRKVLICCQRWRFSLTRRT